MTQPRPTSFVLAYQRADDRRREQRDHFRNGVADVLAYFVVWGILGALAAALLGSVVLWGVLVANTAQ